MVGRIHELAYWLTCNCFSLSHPVRLPGPPCKCARTRPEILYVFRNSSSSKRESEWDVQLSFSGMNLENHKFVNEVVEVTRSSGGEQFFRVHFYIMISRRPATTISRRASSRRVWALWWQPLCAISITKETSRRQEGNLRGSARLWGEILYIHRDSFMIQPLRDSWKTHDDQLNN